VSGRHLTDESELDIGYLWKCLFVWRFSMIFGSAFVPLIGGNALLIPPLFVLLILGPFFVIQLKRREESIERTMGRRCDKGGTAAMFNQAEQASGERWKVASADELTAAINEAAQQYSGKNAERK
jgi:hypothetical protein